MTREFVQVRPDNGYLIHAVPATAEAIEVGYSGIQRWSKHGAICHKIQTRDAQRLPSLSFQFDREKLKQGEYVRLPFTADMLHTSDRPVCVKCAERVMQASD